MAITEAQHYRDKESRIRQTAKMTLRLCCVCMHHCQNVYANEIRSGRV